MAKKDGISINQFAASAIAEKMGDYLTEEYLVKRASEGNHTAFLAAMNKVPNVNLIAGDTL